MKFFELTSSKIGRIASEHISLACDYETSLKLARWLDWIQTPASGEREGIGSKCCDPLYLIFTGAIENFLKEFATWKSQSF